VSTGFSGNGFTVSNLSYMVCGDASDAYPQMIISGDRNIGTATTTGSAGSAVFVPGGGASIGALSVIPAGNYWAWSAGDLHLKTGNLGLTDGSVQTTTIAAMQTAFNNATNGYTGASGAPTTIWYNFPNP
jgi:hypothetical protein